MSRVLTVLVLVALHSARALGVDYSFTHFAGSTGGGGYQDGVGSAARFYRPRAVTVDRNGNTYVAEDGLIRRISVTGNVTTFAGKWREMTSVNGGPGVARLAVVNGLVADSVGNVFFAESSTCSIRKITPDGTVSTFAGLPGSCSVVQDGVGTAARFRSPNAMTIDGADVIYVSEISHTIRKILPDGTVSTLAGLANTFGNTDATGTAARFSNPNGLAADSEGNVYVADRNNHTIRRITPAGVVTTIAGVAGSGGYTDGTGASARFGFPEVMAIDSSDTLFVVDANRHAIRRVTTGGIVTTEVGSSGAAGTVDAPGIAARFNTPRGLASDRGGNLIVADTNNNTIRKVSSTLVVTTLAGMAVDNVPADGTGAAARFGYPRDITFSPLGFLYVTDDAANSIRQIASGGVVTTFTGGNGHGGTDGPANIATFATPIGIASDSSGNLYVADIAGRTVRKITPGGDVSTLAGSFEQQGYVDDTGSAARLHAPHSLAVDSSGNVFVTEYDQHTIRRITPAGVVTTIAGQQGVCGSTDATGTAASFCNPRGITIGSSGHIFVADASNHTIRRIDPFTFGVTTYAGLAGAEDTVDGTGTSARFMDLMEIAADSSGNLYVTQLTNHIRRIDASTGAVTTIGGGPSEESIDGTGSVSRIFNPDGVAFTPGGVGFITGLNDAAIYVVQEAAADTATFFPPANVGSTVQLDATPVTSAVYTWSILRRPAGSTVELSSTTVRNPTFKPDLPDLYTFLLKADTGFGVRYSMVDVLASGACVSPLDSVSIASSGSLSFCGSSDGGTLSVSGITGGGLELSYRWGWRAVPGGPITDIPGANGASYMLHGPDLGGSGTRYLVVTAIPACGTPRVSNEVVVNVLPAPNTTITAPPLVHGHSSGNVASVPDVGPGATYSWSITGGTITSGANSRTITFTARNSSPITLSVTGTLSGCVSSGTKAVAVTEVPYTFEHFAGTTGGPGAIDGEGTGARLRSVTGVEADASGNIYFSDQSATIRMISPAGRVSTLAGLAESIGTTDATGSGARFAQPYGLAIDGSGNVYVAEFGNRRIRRITAAGVVTTFAGSGADGGGDGTGTGAQFRGPLGMAIDSAGNLYVADTNAHTIRKITPGGVVTTLAGSDLQSGMVNATGPAARFFFPRDVAVDAAGNVYVADQSNHLIRRITPGGVVTTYAGAAGGGSADGSAEVARFSNPYGIAIDSQGNVFVSEFFNHRIRKISPSGTVSTLAGQLNPSVAGYTDGTRAAARFTNPVALAVLPGGDLAVADQENFAIRRVSTAGVVTTIAGSAPQFGTVDATGTAARFHTPFAMAFAADGSIFVSDTGSHVIRKVTASGVVTTIAGSPGSFGSTNGNGSAARFNRPGGLAVDGLGNIYVADRGNDAIRRITPSGDVTTVAGQPGAPGTANGTGSIARFNEPTGIVIDSSGNFLISDHDSHTIRKMTPAGVVTTLAGAPLQGGSIDATGAAARFGFPSGLAIDSADNLFVADKGNHDIRKVTPDGVVTTVLANPISQVSTVAVDSTGDLFFASALGGFDDQIFKKPAVWPTVTVIAGNSTWSGATDGTALNARLRGLNHILVDPNGTLYVAEGTNHSIRVGRPTPLTDLASGPSGVAAGSPAALDVAPQTATSWEWSIIRRPGGSAATFSDPSLRNPTFTPDMPDRYRLMVRASNVAGARYSTIDVVATGSCSPTLSGVTASLGGTASFCASGTGGTATATASGGGDLGYRWGWRSVPGGTITDIPGANGPAYLIRGADLGGSGTKYLVVTVVPACGSPVISNEIVLSVLASPDATITTSSITGNSTGNTASVPYAGPGATYAWTIAHGTITAGAGTRTITFSARNDPRVDLTVTVTAGGCPGTGAASPPVTVLPYTFEILAGTTGGIGDYDGPAAAARFYRPVGIAIDRNGNTYVSDLLNTIRKISAAGEVTTLAGLSGAPCGIADGTRSAARFCVADGLTVDDDGNLYVADTYHQAIRKVTPDGVVTTLAGNGQFGYDDGTGASARFANPYGVTWVQSENVLYVVDAAGHTVRRVTMGGVVTTIAGQPGSGTFADGTGSAARFNTPYDLTNDGANLYVADWANHKLRKIDLTTLAVTTLAGSVGPAHLDGTGVAARFGYPHAVDMDPAGNIIVADSYWVHTIRRVTPAGVVTTVAGVPGVPGALDGPAASATFDATSDIAVDRSGAILTGDYNRHGIRKITTAGMVVPFAGAAPAIGSANGTGTAATFNKPYGFGADQAGNLFVSDTDNNFVRAITPAGVVSTLAGTPGPIGGSADGTGAAASFDHPRSQAVDAAGNVYVADWLNHTIRKITPAGVVSTFAGIADVIGSTDGGPGVATFNQPVGIALDAASNVYVTDYASRTIRKITPAGIVSTVAGSPGLAGYVDGNGSAARFNGPHALGLDPAGNIYVADADNHRIRKVTPAGDVSTLAGVGQGFIDGPQSTARFNTPTGVAVDPFGVVYVADQYNSRIRKVMPDGSVTTIGGRSIPGNAHGTFDNAMLGSPAEVALDGNDNVYLVDVTSSNVRVGRATALADSATTTSATVTTGAVVTLDTVPETGGATYQWSVIRRPAGSGAQLSSTTDPNPTFVPDIPDVYTFLLRAQNGSDVRYSRVTITATGACTPSLTSIGTSVIGSTSVCATGTGGTASVTATGGGELSYRWGYRTVSGGAITDIPLAHGSSYIINGADLGGAGTRYLVVTVTPGCGTPIVSAETTITVQPLLSAVAIGVSGSTSVTPTGTGGTATLTFSGGTSVTQQWGYRTTTGGAITNIAGETATTYIIDGADFPTVGNYYLVATATPTCGSVTTSNEVLVTVGSTIATNVDGVPNAAGNSIHLTWTPAIGATSYEVQRSTGGGVFTTRTTTSSTSFDDTATANSTYLYRVKVVGGGDSANAYVGTFVFTDMPVTSGTPIKAVHFTELRAAANALRAFAGLPPTDFTDPTLSAGMVLKRLHLVELRAAVDEARAALVVTPITYTDSVITVGVTSAKVSHMEELRGGVR